MQVLCPFFNWVVWFFAFEILAFRMLAPYQVCALLILLPIPWAVFSCCSLCCFSLPPNLIAHVSSVGLIFPASLAGVQTGLSFPTPPSLGRSTACRLPGGSDSKESACNVEHLGSIPGLRRSLGEGNGYPLQYSCLENPKDRGVWWATVHGAAKIQTWLNLHCLQPSPPSPDETLVFGGKPCLHHFHLP